MCLNKGMQRPSGIIDSRLQAAKALRAPCLTSFALASSWKPHLHVSIFSFKNGFHSNGLLTFKKPLKLTHFVYAL